MAGSKGRPKHDRDNQWWWQKWALFSFKCLMSTYCTEYHYISILLYLVREIFYTLCPFYSWGKWRPRTCQKLCMFVALCVYVQLLSLVRLIWLHELEPTRLCCPWDYTGKNTGVGCHFLLQGIFPSQGSNLSLLCLLHCLTDSLSLSHLGSLSEAIQPVRAHPGNSDDTLQYTNTYIWNLERC